jgi:hypothetical protein
MGNFRLNLTPAWHNNPFSGRLAQPLRPQGVAFSPQCVYEAGPAREFDENHKEECVSRGQWENGWNLTQTRLEDQWGFALMV